MSKLKVIDFDGQFDLEGDYPKVCPIQSSRKWRICKSVTYQFDTSVEPSRSVEGPMGKIRCIVKKCSDTRLERTWCPMKSRILECYKVCGNSYTRDSSSQMAYAWCAAFVSWALYTAGIPNATNNE